MEGAFHLVCLTMVGKVNQSVNKSTFYRCKTIYCNVAYSSLRLIVTCSLQKQSSSSAPMCSRRRRIDCMQMHLSLVFLPMLLMKFPHHCGGDLHLKSHFYEGQGNLFLGG